jgi:ADP-heptose:LPS heptosyltransferase
VVVDDHAAMRKASLTMIFVMLATGARHRVGVAGQPNEFIYTIAVPPAPAGHQMEMASVVASVFGVTPNMEAWRPRIYLSESELAVAAQLWRGAQRDPALSGRARSRRFLVNISATHAKRRWPDEKFIQAVTEIRARHPDLVTGVIGSPADADSVARVASATGGAALSTPGIRDALALVESADLVLTPDTSITHAASAFQTPVVVILRPAMKHYLPFQVPHRAVWVESDTFESLPVAPVVEAVDSLLRELSTITRPA